MLQISNMIRQIDKDRNGYVTTQEIYDILREVYSVRLAKADLSKIVKPFASIQNPILVDYGSWRDWILQTVEKHDVQQKLKQYQTPAQPVVAKHDAINSLERNGVITVSDLVKKRNSTTSQVGSAHATIQHNEVAVSEAASKRDDAVSKASKVAALIEAMSNNPFDTVPAKRHASGSTGNLRDNGSIYSRNSAVNVRNTAAARASSGRFQTIQADLRNLDICSIATSARPATAASSSVNRI